MEPITFDYSTKNIYIPAQKDYIRKLIEKTEHLCRRMRWRAFFHLHPEITPSNKETYGFNSTKSPPFVPELQFFEKQLLLMIRNIRFNEVNCNFQQKLASDIRNKITNSSKLIISADKTSNFYQLDTKQHGDLLAQNITKSYKKISPSSADQIAGEAKSIATNLGLADRINTTAKRDAYITLKDHKANFTNNPSCRLINPTRSEIGKISKQLLDRINKQIAATLKLNQWRNTSSVLDWFSNIANKSECSFIVFDVVDFYPSITSKLLGLALDFASEFETITDEERRIIIHAKKSLLCSEKNYWGKKTTTNLFDVTMGSHDGAETCELVGSFLLHLINQKYGNHFGLYRDDGLGIIRDSAKNIEKTKKGICSIFAKYELKITVEANKKIVNFLDVTLNLNNGKYMPYMKPNDKPVYVHRKSNHPPGILKNIPEAINRRLCSISSDAESFNNAASDYQEALSKSGYDFQLSYTPYTPVANNTNRKRRRNIIWYNPPYSSNVSTNIGRLFLKLIDEAFPVSNGLHKIFNRSTIKISYSCMNNIKGSISMHNNAKLSNDNIEDNSRDCNCRRPNDCPMNGKCLTTSLVYQATVTTIDNRPDQTYVGLTENAFKTRYTNHKASFNHRTKRNATELSKYIWSLKDSNVAYNINWTILKRTSPYNISSGRCNLCLWEKYFIIYRPILATLNKRNELLSSCRHASKYLLSNFKA